MAWICGEGRSCETLCALYRPGQNCIDLLTFALSLDPGDDISPQGRIVLVPVDVV